MHALALEVDCLIQDPALDQLVIVNIKTALLAEAGSHLGQLIEQIGPEVGLQQQG